MADLTIIGGGMAGLATAWAAQEAGLSWRLLEASDRLGGKVLTLRVGDWLIEAGPDSFLTQKPEGLELCKRLGLADQFIPCDDSKRGVCILDGEDLLPIPEGCRLFIPVDRTVFEANTLLSAAGTQRALEEIDLPARADDADESIGVFVTRRFGREMLDKLAGPILAGIYGADPFRLSVAASFPRFHAMERRYGSLMAGMAANPLPADAPSTFTSLAGGMQSMIDSLIPKLRGEVCLNQKVDTLPEGRVVLAVPANVAARFLQMRAPELAAELAGLKTVSTATVSLGFNRSDIEEPNGFGFMSTLASRSPLVGCTWTSNKFAGRSPVDGFLVRAFIGGQKGQERVGESDEALVQLVRDELESLMGWTATPQLSRVFRWQQGNPQYEIGHLERIKHIQSLAAEAGVSLVGSAYGGVGLSDCIREATALFD